METEVSSVRSAVSVSYREGLCCPSAYVAADGTGTAQKLIVPASCAWSGDLDCSPCCVSSHFPSHCSEPTSFPVGHRSAIIHYPLHPQPQHKRYLIPFESSMGHEPFMMEGHTFLLNICCLTSDMVSHRRRPESSPAIPGSTVLLHKPMVKQELKELPMFY